MIPFTIPFNPVRENRDVLIMYPDEWMNYPYEPLMIIIDSKKLCFLLPIATTKNRISVGVDNILHIHTCPTFLKSVLGLLYISANKIFSQA